jgi:hypothetical protein
MRGALVGVFAGALALSSAPALAGATGPLTGSWQLELRCKGGAGGGRESLTFSYFLPIAHTPTEGVIGAGAGDTGALEGFVVFDAEKPDSFWLSLASCDLGSPTKGLSLYAKGKLDGTAGKAKGTAVLLDATLGRVAGCKATIVRTDANPPPVLICP